MNHEQFRDRVREIAATKIEDIPELIDMLPPLYRLQAIERLARLALDAPPMADGEGQQEEDSAPFNLKTLPHPPQAPR